MSLEIPPSRDLCESPIKVNCSCVYKVHSCSVCGVIPHPRAWIIGSAEFPNVLLVETTCSVTFTVTHPWATLESSLHSLIVDPLTQYCVCQSTESKLQCGLYAQAFLIKNRITFVTKSFRGVREKTWDFKNISRQNHISYILCEDNAMPDSADYYF